MNTFAGLPVRVFEHPLCNRIVPNKVHKRRRGQSAAYHRRVQKKWNKRYGTHEEQVAFFINSSLFSLQAERAGSLDALLIPRAVMLKNFAA